MSTKTPRWSSSVEDGPFEAGLWALLSTSPSARNAVEEALAESVGWDRGLVSAMKSSLTKTRAAFTNACDQFPSSREVELLRAVADEAWSAAQSVNCAAAVVFDREVDAMEEAALRWLRRGGRWAYEPGPLPSWLEPHEGYLTQPWTTREATGALEAKFRPYYVDLARKVGDAARASRAMRTKTVARQLRSPAPEGAYHEAHDRAYESCVVTAQSAEAWISARLEHVLDGVGATAQRWWRDGIWEPPPRPRLIWGEFWASAEDRTNGPATW